MNKHITKLKTLVSSLLGTNLVEYDRVMESLNSIYKTVHKIGIQFHDVHSFDFKIVKNVWKPFPDGYSTNVETMGLHIEDDYRSTLTHYGVNGEVKPHLHSKEWEIIQILEGGCYDTHTDTKLTKGDIYIIPIGMEHHIITTDVECFMYVLYTEHKEHLIIPHTEPDLAKKFIAGKKLQRPEKIIK